MSWPKVDGDRFFRASSVSKCALTLNKLHSSYGRNTEYSINEYLFCDFLA